MSDPMSAWQRLRAGNELFFVPTQGRQQTLHQGAPVAAVFRCADTDVASEVVFGQSWGSLIDVSTWGHVVDTGVLGTLEHAVDALDVPLIVVLGHHNCGAMRAAMRAWQNAELPDGASRLAVEQALSSIVRLGSAAGSADEVSSAHVVSVGMSLLERSPVIAQRVDAGRCGIVCATTDHDGRVRAYGTVGALGDMGDALLECV
ncbi:MAG TPA: carbonic anhydrase [Mycobacterium sp.]|jgi:carbonic anhydrase|nr:carbonic anhydrase [Mycobacterium sp.]MCB9416850.1 carbonic anhydrase [Mycolicibacterium sp.]HNA51543.1 carbonic anhydrase [Mycobacterium sp.]HNM96212.1 carbonic anhydrase [Mycobacterium sp.]HNP14593.1 carbonic anhydrase [Mycobacterium sp.]